jgi:TPP-dependent pyruvate/acetoin dehydrogenase alpha subunit
MAGADEIAALAADVEAEIRAAVAAAKAAELPAAADLRSFLYA